MLNLQGTGTAIVKLTPSSGAAPDTQASGQRNCATQIASGYIHRTDPAALVNGDLLTSNGDAVNPDPTHPSEIVEFTKTGQFIGEYNINKTADGAFGVATSTEGEGPGHPNNDIDRLAVVNDNTNDVAVTTFALP